MNNWLIALCVIWVSCSIATAFNKSSDNMAIALVASIGLVMMWLIS